MLPQWHIAWRTDIDIYIPLSLQQELVQVLIEASIKMASIFGPCTSWRAKEGTGNSVLPKTWDREWGEREGRKWYKRQFQTGALQTSSTDVWEQGTTHVPALTENAICLPLHPFYCILHPFYCIGALKSWRWCPFTWVRVICSQSANSDANFMQKHSFGLTAN